MADVSRILELPPDIQLPEHVAAELNMRLLWIGRQLQLLDTAQTSTASGATSSEVTVVATRNERLNLARYDAGSFPAAQFVETDTGLVYVSAPIATGSSGFIWKYLSGTARLAYANPLKSAAAFVKTLDTRDAGLLAYLTDKKRTMRWTGTAFEFAPTEVIPAGMILGFKADPGTGWHICDGSAVTQLNSDATTSAVTLDDLTSASAKAVYPKWGPLADGVQVAIAPKIGGHTELAPTGITVSGAAAATASTGTALAGATQPVVTALTSGGGGGGAVTDPQHQHNLTSGNAPIDTTGEPRHYDLIPYQRI
jgi:hypothetical protein